jgi:hypothetical protein
VNGKLIGPRPTHLRGDHPHEADIAAESHHFVVNGEALLRSQPRDVLDGVVDVIRKRLRRTIAPASVMGSLWSARAIQRIRRPVERRSGLIHQRHRVVRWTWVCHGSKSPHQGQTFAFIFGLLGFGFFADGFGLRRIGRGGFIFTLGIVRLLSFISVSCWSAALPGPVALLLLGAPWRGLEGPHLAATAY